MKGTQVADTEETSNEPRSQMHLHTGFVEWYKTEYGVDLDTLSAAEIIARFAAKRNEYRKSEFYGTVKSSAVELKEAAKAERAEARAAAKAAKDAERAAAKAEKAEKAAAAKKAAPAKQAAKKAPAKKAAPSKATAASKGDDPFA